MKSFLSLTSRPHVLSGAVQPARASHLTSRLYSNTSSGGRRPLPLAGVTVVSLEQAIAAPFCTRQLADLGARVIKVERPGVGDFARHYDTRVGGLASHLSLIHI